MALQVCKQVCNKYSLRSGEKRAPFTKYRKIWAKNTRNTYVQGKIEDFYEGTGTFGFSKRFRHFSQSPIRTIFRQKNAPQSIYLKNRPKKTFLGSFRKFLTKNMHFLAPATPSNLVYI